MSTYTQLQGQTPAASAGRLIGFEDWRFVVEIALPIADTSVLGTFVLGTDVLSGLIYTDITSFVEDTDWDRGGDATDRPETGVLQFRIQDPSGNFAPYQRVYYGPGTVTRVGVGRGDAEGIMTDYRPQFTGIIRTWEEGNAAIDREGWVDVTAWEVMYLLALTDNPALEVAVGDGDTIEERVVRLLTAAQSRFAATVDIDAGFTFVLQPTAMEDDTLTELYQVADTADALMFPTKGGDLAVVKRAARQIGVEIILPPVTSVLGTFVLGTDVLAAVREVFFVEPPVRLVYEGWYDNDVTVVGDSIETANDDALLVADLTITRVGDEEGVTFMQDGIAGRYGYRSDEFAEVWTKDLYAGADLEWLAERILARGGKHPYRPISLQLSSQQTDTVGVVPFLIIADIGQLVDVLRNHRVLFEQYSIARMSHHVTPLSAESMVWECDIQLGVEHTSSWTNLAPFLLTDEGDFLLTDDSERITV